MCIRDRDNGARCSVTNLVSILQNIRWFDKKHPAPVKMKGATSNTVIVPEAEGKLRVQANVCQGYVDVHVYYSPFFTSTLLSDRDVLFATPFRRDYSGQVMSKYFDLNNKKLCDDLKTNDSVDLHDIGSYNTDYGNCALICVHWTTKAKNITIPGIIKAGLCFTLPLILPDLDPSHPDATILNLSTLARCHCK